MSTRRTLGDQLLLTKSSLAEACHLRVIIIDHVPFVLLPPPSTNHRWPLRALHPSTFGEIAHRERGMWRGRYRGQRAGGVISAASEKGRGGGDTGRQRVGPEVAEEVATVTRRGGA
ncbi:unnamed protein product, partial [Musa acuminata subsp. burmannicoides]